MKYPISRPFLGISQRLALRFAELGHAPPGGAQLPHEVWVGLCVPLLLLAMLLLRLTYRVAATGSLGETALWAGNSPDVIRRHYLGAATKVDAEEFYRLDPRCV
jgi:hypothetical protein